MTDWDYFWATSFIKCDKMSLLSTCKLHLSEKEALKAIIQRSCFISWNNHEAEAF